MTQTEALIAIANRDGGRITPVAVIEAARDPDSVLHSCFTWDDTAAANKWRVLEAQRLIRECRINVTSNGRTQSTYAFVGLSVDRTGDSGTNPYRRASEVAESENLLSVALTDAKDQLKAIKNRYSHLTQLSAIWQAIDAL